MSSMIATRTGLGAPPPASDPIEFSGLYTVAAGVHLSFRDSPAFTMHIEKKPSTFDLQGTVSVATHTSVGAVGLTTDANSGQASVDIGEDGAMSVTAKGERSKATAFELSGQVDFHNDGLVQATSTHGDATAVQVTAQDGLQLVNAGAITVAAASEGYGVETDAYDASLNNAGHITVQCQTGAGVQDIGLFGTFDNSGSISITGVGEDVSVAGVLLAGFATFANSGSIRATGADVVGVYTQSTAGFDNSGHITAIAKGGAPSIAVVVLGAMPEVVLTNEGSISGDIAVQFRGVGSYVLVNDGKITGEIDFTNGKELYDGSHGRHVGLLAGGLSDDTLIGGKGGDLIYGDNPKDDVHGQEDVISGGKGDDSLHGGGGSDIITGGAGGDLLVGGAGRDSFVFVSLADSRVGAGDLIADLENTDVIDLWRIDADATQAGDQAFHLVGAFSHAAGELMLSYDAGSDLTTLSGDVDGDGEADIAIGIAGNHQGFSNFVL